MTIRPWDAEWTLTEQGVREILAARFPELADAPVELMGTGWDNSVYLVDGTWAFRFPRRAMAIAGIKRELDVLPLIAPRLPLPIPVPEFTGETEHGPFFGTRMLPGREFAESNASREKAAAGIAEFLAVLHDPANVVDGLPHDPNVRGDSAKRAAMARENLDWLAEHELYTPDVNVEVILADGERLKRLSPVSVLCHGDLHIRHLLVDESGAPTGVIDWGDVCVADPAIDLSFAFASFAGPSREEFFDVYGTITAERELRARVLAVYMCAILARTASDLGQAVLLRESLAGIHRAAG